MQTLINWTAKRAGGRITVYGVDQETGQPVRVVGVDTISPQEVWPKPSLPHAVTHDGRRFALAS
jgi:hypothetical protein